MSSADLPPLIRALQRSEAYPHPTGRIELLQTHISFVLLAGDHVYKIKKPVDFGFLDFSTLAKRRYYCRQETVLNSRLCSDTYLGVVPIREKDGRVAINGSGRTVEYAVHMRRLPAERMMDRLLAEGTLSVEMVRRVAKRVAEFHAGNETNRRIAEFGAKSIGFAWDENFRQWAPNVGVTVTTEQDRLLRAFGERFFAAKRDVLARRVAEGRIRDCHGDLRSDSVCFVGDGLCIFDCIDFSRRLRYTDVAGDVGFLAMDLDYRGRPGLADAFVDAYIEAAGDADLRQIIDFYKCYRAGVRGKVEGFLLAESEVPAAMKRRAREAARRYFDLAARYAESLPPPLLVITCGLAATGKSTLARRLAETAGFEVASSDVVRKRLAGIKPAEHRPDAFGRGIYTADFTDRTYEALLDEARRAIESGRSIVLDATYTRRVHRQHAARLARDLGAQFVCIELRATDGLVRRRLRKREREGGDPSDARWDVYVVQKRRHQRPVEVEPGRLITIDAARPVETQVRAVLAALRKLSPLSVSSPYARSS